METNDEVKTNVQILTAGTEGLTLESVESNRETLCPPESGCIACDAKRALMAKYNVSYKELLTACVNTLRVTGTADNKQNVFDIFEIQIQKIHVNNELSRIGGSNLPILAMPAAVKKENNTTMATSRKAALRKNSQDEEFDVTSVQIVARGDQLIVPEGLDIDHAIAALLAKKEQDAQLAPIEAVFEFGVAEGAVAFTNLLVRKFGWVVNGNNPPGFFRPTKPTFISVEVDEGRTMLIPWGEIKIPNVNGYLSPNFTLVNKRAVFVLRGEIENAKKPLIDEIINELKTEVAERSIYRGKAVKVTFPEVEDPYNFNVKEFFPKFLELEPIPESQLILRPEIHKMIKDTLWTPIEKTETVRDWGAKLKRTILLEGRFGVGKSLTAAITMDKCVKNGWTYLYVKSVMELVQAFEFAKHYQPCVIFAEDLDMAFTAEDGQEPEDRTDEVNDILNTIDGIDSKKLEIMVVLTTNNLDKIGQGMLRHGRIDTLIRVTTPDGEAATRLIHRYGGNRLQANAAFEPIGESLAGQLPATIAEVVEHSKLSAIQAGRAFIMPEDMRTVVNNMLEHMKLLEPKTRDDRTETQKAADTQADAIRTGLAGIAQAISTKESVGLDLPTNGKGGKKTTSTEPTS